MGIARRFRTSEDIIRDMTAIAPPGSPLEPQMLANLHAATAELIALYQSDGMLDESPMTLAMERDVTLQAVAARQRLQGSTVMVTGGEGCVGSRLIPLLAQLGAARIIVVDHAPDAGASDQKMGTETWRVDIRDVEALDAAFASTQPSIVFHLASIREPGRAEAVVREAIETNVFGTRNVIDACLRHGVEDAIYSSTGKCFAYVTDHVYTGSKKLAEAQWAVAARASKTTRFRCTRFTHVMENGLVTADIMAGVQAGIVSLHGPDRNFNIQNLRQATHLLVNALALAKTTPVDGFWSAVDLGWPVNTLELALYTIHQSGKPAAIRFLGVPPGYDEMFFRGQFGWAEDDDYHPLINALEAPARFSDDSGTMTGATIQRFAPVDLDHALAALESALADDSLDAESIKAALLDSVTALARSIFAHADIARLIDVLWWGAAPAWSGPQARDARRFHNVIQLLTETILARRHDVATAEIPEMHRKFTDIARTLRHVETLAPLADPLDRLAG